jgi:hypothetical protein
VIKLNIDYDNKSYLDLLESILAFDRKFPFWDEMVFMFQNGIIVVFLNNQYLKNTKLKDHLKIIIYNEEKNTRLEHISVSKSWYFSQKR